MNPKPNKKIVLRSRVLRNNCLEELFHTVPSSFVLHCTTRKYEEVISLSINGENESHMSPRGFSVSYLTIFLFTPKFLWWVLMFFRFQQ